MSPVFDGISEEEGTQLWGETEVPRRQFPKLKFGIFFAVGLLAGCIGASVFIKSTMKPATASEFILASETTEEATEENEDEIPVTDHERHKERKDLLETSLPAARTRVRAKVLKLKEEGKSIKEIKKAGYTRRNLGCKQGEGEKAAFENCLTALKDSFTPDELVELLDLESDHDLIMLSKQGLKPKVEGWEVGKEVLMCWTGDKDGCTLRKVREIKDGKARLRHLVFDTKTGKVERGDWKFTVYTLNEWDE